MSDREAGKTGPRYYRLAQRDLNGAVSYSPVRTVLFDELLGSVQIVGIGAIVLGVMLVELGSHKREAPAEVGA